jgi:hypothetical protein
MTDFSLLASSVRQSSTVSEAIDTLVSGIASMLAALNSQDDNVAFFASDLGTNSGNLKNAALLDAVGNLKDLGGSEATRAQYLDCAGA